MHKVYLGLGTNLGDKEANIARAVNEIEELIGRVDRRSALYVTEPWGFASDNLFVNACVRCLTDLSPEALLASTQQIERTMGRTLKSVDGCYHDRIIDIDILLYDDITYHSETLTIPHPLIEQRDFVKIPLREIME